MEKQTVSNRVPSTRWYALPVGLFFLGPLLSLYLFYSVLSRVVHTMSFFIPGTAQIEVIQPGTYTLWTLANSEDATIKLANDMRTMTLNFIDIDKQKAWLFHPKPHWQSRSYDGIHISLGTVKFDHYGKYQMQATSPSTTSFYRVYLRKPSFPNVVGALALALLISYLSLMGAIISAIIILIKRTCVRRNMNTEEEVITPQITTWAMICHLSGFIGFLFPFANIIAPLLIWGFKRHESAYLEMQGKEAVNFQISITIYYAIAFILIFVLIGLFLLPILAAFHIIAMIIASIESAHAKPFRYPLSIRFLS